MKNRHFTMKYLSNLEYERQFNKARTVIEQLHKIKNKKKANNQNNDIFKEMMQGNFINREELIKNTEKLMKKEGINFHKDDYQAFGAYLNYDVNGSTSLHKLNHEVFS